MARGQESSVDSTQIYRSKKRLFTAIGMIERDFRNLGSGVFDVSATPPISEIDTLACSATGYTCKFSFLGRVDSTTQAVSAVSYKWTKTSKTAIIDLDLSATDNVVTVPLYTLEREVDGAANTLKLDNVTMFRVNTFDDDANPAFIISDVRQIEVELAVLVPTTMTEEQIEVVRWSSFFRPTNLTRLP